MRQKCSNNNVNILQLLDIKIEHTYGFKSLMQPQCTETLTSGSVCLPPALQSSQTWWRWRRNRGSRGHMVNLCSRVTTEREWKTGGEEDGEALHTRSTLHEESSSSSCGSSLLLSAQFANWKKGEKKQDWGDVCVQTWDLKIKCYQRFSIKQTHTISLFYKFKKKTSNSKILFKVSSSTLQF